METKELQNQIALKQNELNFTTDIQKKQAIQSQITRLRLKLEIEEIKKKIDRLSHS